jgi:hypothetical protein
LPPNRRRILYTPSSQVIKSAACGRRCSDHRVYPASWSVHLVVGEQTHVRFCSPFCSSGSHLPGCVTHLPARADMEQYKQIQLHETADNLSIPSSLSSIGETLLINLLFVLMLIFAGTMVGDEYSLGTVRLLYMRGPTRLHFLVAKVATVIMCILPAVLLLTLVGVILGEGLYSIMGFSTRWSFFTASWLGHVMVFVLLEVLAWFAYAMLALFFGTLARSTVAAVLAPFVWDIVESALRELIRALLLAAVAPSRLS